jgi:hypothetical protein
MTLTSFAYVSPRTGTEYLVVPREETRMVGDWYKGETLRPEIIHYYEIVLNGNPVHFTYVEDGVAAAVAHYEGKDDGWYCLPRD